MLIRRARRFHTEFLMSPTESRLVDICYKSLLDLHRCSQSTVNKFKSPGKRYSLCSNVSRNVQSQSGLFLESLKFFKALFLAVCWTFVHRIAVSKSCSVLGISLSLGVNTRPRRLCPLRCRCEPAEMSCLKNKDVCLSVKHLTAVGKRQLLLQRFLLKAPRMEAFFFFFLALAWKEARSSINAEQCAERLTCELMIRSFIDLEPSLIMKEICGAKIRKTLQYAVLF